MKQECSASHGRRPGSSEPTLLAGRSPVQSPPSPRGTAACPLLSQTGKHIPDSGPRPPCFAPRSAPWKNKYSISFMLF